MKLTHYTFNRRSKRRYIAITPDTLGNGLGLLRWDGKDWMILMQDFAPVRGFSSPERALQELLSGAHKLPEGVKLEDIPTDLSKWVKSKLG